MNEDKPTKGFLSRGKNSKVKTRITKIIKNGNIMIGNEAEQHMMDLFKKLLGNKSKIDEEYTVEEFLGDAMDKVPRLMPDLAERMKDEITLDELDKVVRKSHTNSSPGMCGVSYQLIKLIWPLIRKLFHRATLQIMGSNTKPPHENAPRLVVPEENPSNWQTKQAGRR